MRSSIYVVVLNWNAGEMTAECVESLRSQSQPAEVIVVDNGSIDDSIEILEKRFPKLQLIKESKNHGFAGGVNIGMRYAIEHGAEYVALLNNDAVIDKDWLKILLKDLEKSPELGAVTGKLLSRDGKHIDSTGDFYTSWGLPIARQRNVRSEDAVNEPELVFGATAGASLYRVAMLKEVGLMDETFFAYYEDTDLNFRIQLAGWKILYNPKAVGYHATGSTSSRMNGFTTQQTIKNLPILFWKNVPFRLLPHILPRFYFAYFSVMASSLIKGRIKPVLKGFVMLVALTPHIFRERQRIQKTKKVTTDYIRSLLLFDLPPDAYKLRRVRSFFTGKS